MRRLRKSADPAPCSEASMQTYLDGRFRPDESQGNGDSARYSSRRLSPRLAVQELKICSANRWPARFPASARRDGILPSRSALHRRGQVKPSQLRSISRTLIGTSCSAMSSWQYSIIVSVRSCQERAKSVHPCSAICARVRVCSCPARATGPGRQCNLAFAPHSSAANRVE